MDYKEKYEQALEKARELMDKGYDVLMPEIFPELQESEDEKVRLEIRNFIWEYPDKLPERTKWLAWFEKQGKYSWKPTEEQLEALDYAYNSCPDTERGNYYESILADLIADLHKLHKKQDENKPADKVEPKFKPGDWIVFNGLILHIDEVVNGYYRTTSRGDGIHNSYDWDIDNAARLWTIQEAKDGDVLVTLPEEGSESNEQIFLFKAINSRDYVDNCIEYYGRLCDDRFYKNKTGYMGTTLDSFYPATKEQRVLFFQKMKEANYVWNVYNKKLTKIEQQTVDKAESKFHEGDLIVINETTYQIAEIDNSHVVLSLNGRECNFGLDVLDNAHFWTIEDAKDGDVLVCNINKAEIGGDVEKLPNMTPTICIYQNVVKDSEYIHSYCSLYDENSLVLQNTMYYNAFVYNIHPATKEQRDLLFQKMAEAGYEWNSENKELKKIEPKKVNADKVIEWLKGTIRETKEYLGEHGEYYDTHLTLPYDSVEDLINDFKEDFEL